jgi:hypothetical protein
MSSLAMDKLKTCRCCVREIEFSEELHEFSSEVAIDADTANPHNFIKISDCYTEILFPLTISEDDEDVTKICSSCLGDLKFCYLFKRKCIESSKVFEQEQDVEESIGELYDFKF